MDCNTRRGATYRNTPIGKYIPCVSTRSCNDTWHDHQLAVGRVQRHCSIESLTAINRREAVTKELMHGCGRQNESQAIATCYAVIRLRKQLSFAIGLAWIMELPGLQPLLPKKSKPSAPGVLRWPDSLPALLQSCKHATMGTYNGSR